MPEHQTTPTEPPPDAAGVPSDDEQPGLNPDGADIGMGEPNSFEPEEA
jgi:hypothetical protein